MSHFARTDTQASALAMGCLARTRSNPEPAQQFNPGVVQRLILLGLAQLDRLPSPYAAHLPGTKIDFLICTDAGIAELKRRGFMP